MLLDKDWVEDLPIYTYLIQHPEGNFLVDSGDTAENTAKGRIFGCLPQYFPRWLTPTLIEFSDRPFGPFARSHPLTKDGNIVLVPTPGHMRGHLSVIVRSPDVTWCLAGDSTYDERFLLEELVDGVTYDVELSKRTLRQVLALGPQEPTILLPAHDRRVPERLSAGLCLPRKPVRSAP